MLNIAFRRNYQSICPQTIQWILNLRQQKSSNDGHSDERLEWIKSQSRYIDSKGWENWLKSERAFGYDWYNKSTEDKLIYSIRRISKNNTN